MVVATLCMFSQPSYERCYMHLSCLGVLGGIVGLSIIASPSCSLVCVRCMDQRACFSFVLLVLSLCCVRLDVAR